MKEQIIAILRKFEEQPFSRPSECADEIMALFAEAMPTEEECDNRAVEISGGLKMYYEGFIKGCDWFRNRMKGEK